VGASPVPFVFSYGSALDSFGIQISGKKSLSNSVFRYLLTVDVISSPSLVQPEPADRCLILGKKITK
jgi:hypothetical protein